MKTNEGLREEIEILKQKKVRLDERNALKKELITLKKGLNLFAIFLPSFKDINFKENAKEIWSPIKSVIIGLQNGHRQKEREYQHRLNSGQFPLSY